MSKAEETAYAKTLKWKEHSFLRNLTAGECVGEAGRGRAAATQAAGHARHVGYGEDRDLCHQRTGKP